MRRELAPIAALLCLGLGPLFGRWSWLAGGLLLAGSSSAVFLATAVAGHAGILDAPGAPLSAVLLALAIGALSRLEAAAGTRGAPAPAEAGMAALMPSLAEHSTAPILVFDSDGCIRACNRALGEMFGYAAGDLVGTSFGRLLEVPSHDQPRLFRRSDGLVRALMGRRRDGRRFHLHAALSTLDWPGDRLRVAVLHDVSEVRADQELLALTDNTAVSRPHRSGHPGRGSRATAGGGAHGAPSALQADRGHPRSTLRG